MATINLLPWREARRIERTKRFNVLALGALILATAAVVSAYAVVQAQLLSQRGRNAYLDEAIETFQQQQRQMQALRAEERRLLSRLDVIEALQLSRPLAVYLLDSVAHLAPNDVRIVGIEQHAQDLEIRGVVSKAAAIPDFMRRLGDSAHFSAHPELISIERKAQTADQVEFVLRAQQAFPKASAVHDALTGTETEG